MLLIPSDVQTQVANPVVERSRIIDTAVQTIPFDIEAQEYPKQCIGNGE